MQSDSYPPLVFSKIKIHNHFCKLACSERFPKTKRLGTPQIFLAGQNGTDVKIQFGSRSNGIPIKSEILTNFRLDTSSNETYLECKMRNLTPSLDRDVKLALFPWKSSVRCCFCLIFFSIFRRQYFSNQFFILFYLFFCWTFFNYEAELERIGCNLTSLTLY